ncbi:hypothetical protein A2688_02390 [Candidatus Daviesbacteria bacterium RIFCSPHIGHO2_01_FULL_38_8]|nr:MAG: hypothetical protein A2688_02390 [Candidatus Daviesbacteria bacterium RIFCSPHIGHO2_01_FULL_38_8]
MRRQSQMNQFFPSKIKLFSLFIIILLAFVLRFYRVVDVPPSLNWDEVSIGYNAYSILKTGRDEWGALLPTHFKSYGEYKLPVQIYASIPAIAIFDLNDFSVRLTPVIYGTLTVLLIFLLGRGLFKSNVVGLASAFLLAISPWHIQLTRASFESSFALFWIVLGVWLLLKGFYHPKWSIMSMIPFAVSVYTYNTTRVFTPLFLFSILIIHFNTLKKYQKYIFLSIAVFAILMLPLVPYYTSGEGNSRYKLVSITDDPGLIPRVNERRGNSELPWILPRLIHSKYSYTAAYFIKNYFSHLTPQFLFISGAPHKQHHVQNIGQLYLIQAPFLLLGLFLIFKNKNQFRWLILSWMLLSFIPVSITNDSIPHALRTLVALPTYLILSAYGFYVFYQWLVNKKNIVKVSILFTLAIILGLQFTSYIKNYYFIYPKNYSRDWQYGNKQAVEFIKDRYEDYDLIVFTRAYGEPHMFTLFYSNYDSAKFRNDPNLERFETFDWVRVLKFDKFYFPDLGDEGTGFRDIIAQNPDKRILFIGKQVDFPQEHYRLKTIDFLNGDRAFDIVEIK